jgi:prepilin-type N-terminal cleavage/methylation domain-containing protein
MKRSPQAASLSRSRGFTLLEMLVVIVIATMLTTAFVRFVTSYLDGVSATHVGTLTSQYNNAVRNWLIANKTVPNGTVQNGIGWLETAACGGTSAVLYLPCNFPTTPGLGGTFSTTISNPGGGNVTATTTVGPITVRGKKRGDLAGLAAQVAAAFYAPGAQPSSSFGTYSANNPLGTVEATAALTAGTNSDPWLRTDGSNKMENDINFDTTALSSNINNVNDVNANALIAGTGTTTGTYDKTGSTLVAPGFSASYKANQATIQNTGTGDTTTVSDQSFKAQAAAGQYGQLSSSQVYLQNATGSAYMQLQQTYLAFVPDSSNPANSDLISTPGGSFIFTNGVTNTFQFNGNAGPALTIDLTGTSQAGAAVISGGPGQVAGSNSYGVYVNGNLGTDDVYVASRGAWLSNLLPHWVFEDTFLGGFNSTVGYPDCPDGGTPRILLGNYQTNMIYGTDPTSFALYLTTMDWRAVDTGTNWVLKPTSYFQGNTDKSSTVLAETFCYYP